MILQQAMQALIGAGCRSDKAVTIILDNASHTDDHVKIVRTLNNLRYRRHCYLKID
jgi:hypothetical protein